MKTVCAVMVVGLALVGPASAQPYGGRDSGYGRDYGNGRDDGYRDRGYGNRDYDDRDRGRGFRDRDSSRDRDTRDRGFAFDEREYLRCNPDVRQAIANGQMKSGAAHYQVFGRREGRKLGC